MSAVGLVEVLVAATEAIADVIASTSIEERQLRSSGHDDQYKVDILADAAAIQILIAAGVGVLSEESGRHAWDRPVRVVLDPIDGSTNCSRGLPAYGPSICAVDDLGPLAGVVLNIPAQALFVAIRGDGATRNGQPLKTTRRQHLAVVGTGDPVAVLEHAVSTRISGASSHDLCLVADGTLDGYVDFRNTESIWDYLAAVMIVRESGGVVRERDNQELFDFDAVANRRLIAAGTPRLFAELVATLNN